MTSLIYCGDCVVDDVCICGGVDAGKITATGIAIHKSLSNAKSLALCCSVLWVNAPGWVPAVVVLVYVSTGYSTAHAFF